MKRWHLPLPAGVKLKYVIFQQGNRFRNGDMSQALSDNSIISNYRIVSRLGVGGIGEVYLAEDSRLHLQVALKVLPRTIASDTDHGSNARIRSAHTICPSI